jgi:type IV secretory pathway VirB6-like protein
MVFYNTICALMCWRARVLTMDVIFLVNLVGYIQGFTSQALWELRNRLAAYYLGLSRLTENYKNARSTG